MVEITLSWGEVEHAGIIGCLRRVSALRNNRPEPWGVPPGERWRNDIESSAAEMAAAKATNQYWHAFYDDPKKAPGDIGHDQVRWTDLEYGQLICHRNDKDDARFYLVVGSIPTFQIVGSMLGRDAKQEQWWDTKKPRPAFFIPQKALTHFYGKGEDHGRIGK